MSTTSMSPDPDSRDNKLVKKGSDMTTATLNDFDSHPQSSTKYTRRMSDVTDNMHEKLNWSLNWLHTGGGEDEAPDGLVVRKVELVRRNLLKRAVGADSYQIMRTWKGTIFPHLTQCPEVWFTLALYTFVRIWTRVHVLDDLFSFGTKIPIDMANVGKLGGFFSFFLIFYAQQAYTRFTVQYEASMGCEGAIADAMMLARATMPRAAQLKLMRYMNAAHVMAYIGLTPAYTSDNLFDELQENRALLTSAELQRMKGIDVDVGGSTYREAIAWCIHLSHEMGRSLDAQGRPYLSPFRQEQMDNCILKLRGKLGKLFDYGDQPVPFFYVHLVWMMSLIYLPLFTLGVASDPEFSTEQYPEVCGFVIVLACIVFIIGFRTVADKMQNPYGSDFEDLSVMHYLVFTLRMSRRILEAQIPDAPSPEAELEMNDTRNTNEPIKPNDGGGKDVYTNTWEYS